ncbi:MULTISPECIES: class II fumarate hydratase [Marinobacter]|uniref:Fumarate hydratase class II n=1 Tax=Marinobacter suaedae TaxID=3057675 RepID=A0ABT8VY97_9GAMM|nr:MULTISPECIES: class II fumarate hydratase [unclassified Marinobacter]MBZ2169096.1 class II fumarate hydratase [Marinobacter sp. F4216]MDO3720965.1 class II fumarate hydratase [Marinobacter sp. chi1]
MSQFRIETDSLGDVQVPVDALWGAQTQRAVENFPVSGLAMPAGFIAAVAHIKWAAAEANASLGLLENEQRDAIVSACQTLIEGEYADQFPVDRYQTGSGTSTNMNVNEVVAAIIRQQQGMNIHPNDHVNMSQSSNDVIPTAIHISAATAVQERLIPALTHLCGAIYGQESRLAEQVKTGRTHLMDAMPVTLGQELRTWREQILACKARLETAMDELLAVPQGGTAVGTGVNAGPEFAGQFIRFLKANTGYSFRELEHKFVGQSAVDAPVALSGQLRGVAIVLTKIANDLRWMNSGPIHGLAEISLPALQPGSSIMPGKVNPVIPESVAMAAAQVMGLDSTVAIAGQSGNFQLNVMLPLVAANLLDMIALLSNASNLLADKAIHGFTVNAKNLNEGVGRNPVLVTALNPEIGYSLAADIAKEAYASGRPVIDVAEERSGLSRERLEQLMDPLKLTHQEVT